jgi:hypothetical protein
VAPCNFWSPFLKYYISSFIQTFVSYLVNLGPLFYIFEVFIDFFCSDSILSSSDYVFPISYLVYFLIHVVVPSGFQSMFPTFLLHDKCFIHNCDVD